MLETNNNNDPSQHLLSPGQFRDGYKMNEAANHGLHDAKSVSSYSEMLHPNADPSEISQLGGAAPKDPVKKQKLGCIKRGFGWVDENWLKKLLVSKSSEQM